MGRARSIFRDDVKLLALIDGEHHPPSVRDAISSLDQGGDRVVAAVFCGGTEKVSGEELDEAYGVPVSKGADLRAVLAGAIRTSAADAIIDMTDEPILTPAQRFQLASVALAEGVIYRGADFELRPPIFEDVLTKPSVSVFATGKRTGKTAVASSLARHAVGRDRSPVIVAVGRGGPNPPRVIEAGTLLDPDALLEMVDGGLHASSDYVEDALTSGVTTIGCVRVGGGLAGATITSNMAEGARMAEGRDTDLVILEGSGASIPEVRARVGLMCVPASIGPEAVGSYLNPYRLLLADLCVVTLADDPALAAETVAAIKEIRPDLATIDVVFRPTPLADVQGRKAFFCTTAPKDAGERLKTHLEDAHRCEVVGMSHHLSDRSKLRTEIAEAEGIDVLLVELKAAAVDVVVRAARDKGVDVVFVNNEPMGTGLAEAFDRLLVTADERTDRPGARGST
jgi:cyclic 2,3-diphosphoglycerate synthase